MFTKRSFLLSTLALAMSASTFANDINDQHIDSDNQVQVSASPLITSAMIAGWVLDGAKSAVKGGAKSFLTGLLFGNGNSGPQIVRIHQEDLDKIESIVSGIVLTSDVEDAKSQFESFGDTLGYYRSSAEAGNIDVSIVPILLNYTTSLKNHRAYKTYYNPKSYALTSSYALIASMSVAVLTERKLQGYLTYGYVQSQARSLAASLSSLGAATDTYVSSLGRVRHFGNGCYNFAFNNDYDITASLSDYAELEGYEDYSDVEMIDDTPMAPQGCFVIASFPGQGSKSFDTDHYGMMEAEELAWEFLSDAKNNHRNVLKGENFNQILATLNNF